MRILFQLEWVGIHETFSKHSMNVILMISVIDCANDACFSCIMLEDACCSHVQMECTCFRLCRKLLRLAHVLENRPSGLQYEFNCDHLCRHAYCYALFWFPWSKCILLSTTEWV